MSGWRVVPIVSTFVSLQSTRFPSDEQNFDNLDFFFLRFLSWLQLEGSLLEFRLVQ